MSFNVAGAIEIPLEVFGGLVTEQSPITLPAGVSPDTQEGIYIPGAWGSRPPLSKVFASAFTGGTTPTVTYGKSYVDKLGVVRNLYLDANGQLWLEQGPPAAASSLAQLFATGIYCKSVTAFGREYLAPSDGLHGADIPLQYDGTNLDRVTQEGPAAAPTVANLAIAPAAVTEPNSLVRANATGLVTATTTNPHSFKVGYQVLIQGAAGAPIGGAANNISTIVIDNEDSPGIATLTLTGNHGLAPGQLVYIQGVTAVTVGTGITSTSSTGGICTVTTSAAHGLSPGALITIASAADATVNGTWLVASIVSATVFTFATGATGATSGGAAGTVKLNFPVAGISPDDTQFTVLTCPSSTVFTVQLAYSDGSWASGTVYFPWNGTFYVTSVPSNVTFTYSNPGPTAATTALGGPAQVSYAGQVTPGVHQCQVLFVTRQGYVTKPSPPVQFTAAGGQYLTVSNLPIGPANVVARILAFTGAGGAQYFYLPVPAMVNGQQVSQATQINDNTTTTVTLDFGDSSLFAGLAISIPGNNLASQLVLDGAVGFGFYGSRLLTWGQRNRIQNLLNVMFDGGYLSGASTVPLGWTVAGAGSLVTSGRWGGAYQLGAASNLSQSFYLDAYGAPIGTPNATYRARCWLKGATASVTITISSSSTAFSSTVTLTTTSTTGVWVEGAFNNAMPSAIPSDMLLVISGTSGTVDEISILYAQLPFLDTLLFASYVNNPEGFDGVSGKFGPATDTHKVMDLGILRDNLYLVTQDPAGRLHQTANNGVTEPAGWNVSEVGANCGALSSFSVTKSQADDASAGGGEEWFAWASVGGARIFGGDQPYKISQEIQPDWAAINPAAALTVWALNDPQDRVIYFGLPLGSAGAPNLIYPVNYRELETAYEIAESRPVRNSFSGKLIATDHTRKWSRWNLAMNGAALLYRSTGQALTPVFFNGNGSAPGVAAGFGNVYILAGSGYTDADYGRFYPWYVTHFFVQGDAEQALQLGSHRKQLCYYMHSTSGSGHVTTTPLLNSLSNPGLSATRTLTLDPTFDQEVAANHVAQRIAFKIAVGP